MTAVLTAVAKQGPAELARSLLREVGSLGSVKLEIPTELIDVNRGADAAAKLGEGAADAVGGVGKSAQDAVRRFGDAFRRGEHE